MAKWCIMKNGVVSGIQDDDVEVVNGTKKPKTLKPKSGEKAILCSTANKGDRYDDTKKCFWRKLPK